MTTIQIIATVLAAVATAVIFERLLRQYLRKLRDDCARMDVAHKALKDQQSLLDRIVGHKSIAPATKLFVVELSGVIPQQKTALRMAEWIKDGMPSRNNDEKEDQEADQFFEELRALNKSDPDAFELVVGALRGAFVTMMLQWPTTARAMQMLAHKLAVESTTQVAKSAAAVHRAARFHHWIDTDHAIPA
jgi:hypothetical protein